MVGEAQAGARPVKALLLVFIGGGVGSVLRYLLGVAAAERLGPFTAAGGWPWGTFLVNAVGCFAIGLGYRLLPAPADGPGDARLLLMTGVLGGFTTFSAFALDSAQLWLRQDVVAATLYIAGTLLFTLGGPEGTRP
jgi:fluoride exporter